MTPSTTFEIAVLPGDGIGVEVTSAAVEVLDALSAEIGGIRFNWRHYPGGAQTYRDTGVALADETLKALEQADAILFGAMGLPDIRYPDGTEIAPQLDIRVGLDLYAGVRPIRAMAGLSMGSMQTLQITLNHLDQFAWIGAMSGPLSHSGFPNSAARVT